MFLRDFQSLSIYDCCSPVKKQHYVFPTTVVKIPETYLPNAAIPTVSVSEEEVKSDKTNDEDDKTNIRASSIPRPRAVISSPDNDAMIGNINKTEAERQRAVKTQTPVQNRHVKCKIKPSEVTPESAISTRKSKDPSDTKGKKGSAVAVSRQRPRRKEWES